MERCRALDADLQRLTMQSAVLEKELASSEATRTELQDTVDSLNTKLTDAHAHSDKLDLAARNRVARDGEKLAIANEKLAALSNQLSTEKLLWQSAAKEKGSYETPRGLL